MKHLKKGYIICLVIGLLIISGIINISASILHFGNDFKISIDGTEKSLQNTINEDSFVGNHTYTMPSSIPDPGHGPNEIWVSVNGNENTLLNALSTTGICGISSPSILYVGPVDKSKAYHYADEIEVSPGKTLQDSINSGELVVVDGDWSVWPAWNTCSVLCDGGTQSRTRTCTNPDPYCGGLDCVGINTESQACNIHSCYNYSWSGTPWDTCSVSCGGGTQTRTVYCNRTDGTNMGGTCDVYPGCECATKPPTSQACNTQECHTYDWKTGGWGSCSAECGGGTQTRPVYCERDDGVQVSDSYCSGSKPSSSQTCNTATDKDEGACMTSGCYAGIMDYDCSNGEWVPNYCAATTPYEFLCTGGKICQAGSCVYTYSWYTSSWSACSVSCGGGTQTRTVYCRRNDGIQASDGYCSGSKPSNSQTCNTQCCKSPYGGSCSSSSCCESGLTCCRYCNRCYYSCPNSMCKAPNGASCSQNSDCSSGCCSSSTCKSYSYCCSPSCSYPPSWDFPCGSWYSASPPDDGCGRICPGRIGSYCSDSDTYCDGSNCVPIPGIPH